jgi:peptidoglycan hydrolase-like protein with peptidoglycan-binding domain
VPRTVRPMRRTVLAISFAAAMVVGSLAGASPASAYTTRVDLGRGVGTPWISLIGDSTLSGVRWTNSYWPLERFNYTFDAESCRRTIAPSCRGREGYAPQTALQTMQRLRGSLGHVVILMTGYNDPGTGFAAAVDAIVAEARRQGLLHVIWLTMRTADVSYVSPTYRSDSYTFRDNNRILLQKAQQYGGYLQIADWATHSAARPTWVGSDGVHLTASGAVAVTTFIADMAAQVFAGATITPPPTAVDGWVTLRRGDRGATVAAIQRALMAMGARLVGGADGIFGIYTERAVAGFQSRRGLAITGQVDGATARALGIATSGLSGPPPVPATTWTDVALGARGASVAGIQQALMNAGIFLRGGADGVFGAYTQAAVASYQRLRGLPATGLVDETTAIALGVFAPPRPTLSAETWTELSVGARGAVVQTVQQALIDAGIVMRGGADGIFGKQTRAAVATFQRRNGLPETGVVDVATAVALRLFPPPAPVAPATTVPPPTTAPRQPATTAPRPPATTSPATTTTPAPTTTTTTVPPVTTTTTAAVTTTSTVPVATTTTAPPP